MITNMNWQTLLESILAEFGCQTGTIHRAAAGSELLTLVCQIGVPESLLGKISEIPFGKGIAGAAAERREAVELCNLQTDLGGVAREDARKSGVAGSLAVPILSETTDDVIGTLGIGKYVPYEFSEDEKLSLAAHARVIAGYFAENQGRGD